MPTLHSLSIRRRGATRNDNSTKPSAANTAHTVYTIKSLFHRKASSNRKTSCDSDRSDNTHTMGNAPSDMNQGSPKANGTTAGGTPKKSNPQLARASTVSDGSSSIRSRAMPGAEPPTPVPAEPIVTKDEPPQTPHMEKVQLQVSEVQEAANAATAEGEGDLEAGVLPPVGTFEVEEAGTEALASQEAAARTPRAELKTEELLAPLDLTPSRSPTGHAPETSDATVVSVSPTRSVKGLATASPLWTPGTYVLLNARGGTAVDLHGGNNSELIGFPMHGGPNQQWEFIPSGHGYAIRCVRPSKAGHALYLTVEGVLGHKAPIVASPYPVAWNVEQTEEGLRISWPNSDFVFDLADWGSSAPGTRIELVQLKPGERCQLWHYRRCAPLAEREHEKGTGAGAGMEVEAQSSRAISPPAATETVTITETHDFVTTTRTTTTTVITTVTEVTRTPKALLLRQPPTPQSQGGQRRSIGYR